MQSHWSRVFAGMMVVATAACGPAGGSVDGGAYGLEPCASTGGATLPRAGFHLELAPSGVQVGSALGPVNGKLALRPGGPAIGYSDFFTRTTAENQWPRRAAVLGPPVKGTAIDDLSVLLDPTLVGEYQTFYGFNATATGQALADYRAAIELDPATQLAVRVGVNGPEFLVSGQSVPSELRPWTAGDTLVGGATRFLAADVTAVFDFEGDAACHVRNLGRILQPEGPLAFSQFFGTKSAEQLAELQRYLAVAKPHTRFVTLRSNGPAFANLPTCDLASLETCLGFVEGLEASVNAWLAACPAPTDASLKAATPETCLVEGRLTLRPYP